MEKRRWLAWVIIGAWGIQLLMLWPLPQTIATSWDLPPDLAVDTERRLWSGWILRAVLAVLGLISGVLLLRLRRAWAPLFLASAGVYVFFYSQWFSFHAQALESWAAFLTRMSWLWLHPGLLFMTLVFPIFLVAVSICAFVDLAKRGGRHAI
jgi:hypothetical protein